MGDKGKGKLVQEEEEEEAYSHGHYVVPTNYSNQRREGSFILVNADASVRKENFMKHGICSLAVVIRDSKSGEVLHTVESSHYPFLLTERVYAELLSIHESLKFLLNAGYEDDVIIIMNDNKFSVELCDPWVNPRYAQTADIVAVRAAIHKLRAKFFNVLIIKDTPELNVSADRLSLSLPERNPILYQSFWNLVLAEAPRFPVSRDQCIQVGFQNVDGAGLGQLASVGRRRGGGRGTVLMPPLAALRPQFVGESSRSAGILSVQDRTTRRHAGQQVWRRRDDGGGGQGESGSLDHGNAQAQHDRAPWPVLRPQFVGESFNMQRSAGIPSVQDRKSGRHAGQQVWRRRDDGGSGQGESGSQDHGNAQAQHDRAPLMRNMQRSAGIPSVQDRTSGRHAGQQVWRRRNDGGGGEEESGSGQDHENAQAQQDRGQN